MNERIKQLAEQALQLVADECTNGDKSRLNTDSYHVKDLINEKFAELIVEECMWKIMQRKEEAIDNNWRVDEAMSAAITDISEHFGVEE